MVTADDFMVPSPPPTRMFLLTLVPLWLDWPPREAEAGPPPEPAVGAWVTVTSVPTPYSDLSTVPWVAETPFEAAVTVMTSPTPSASPSAMKIDCRILRRSSRSK